MGLVLRRSEGRYLVLWNAEILATYDTHAEAFAHVIYGYPAENRAEAEKIAEASAKAWREIKTT